MRDGDVEFLGLDLGRGFDEGGGQTGFDVPFDVAVEELDSGVVGDPTDGDGAVAGDLDCVATHWWCAGRCVVGEEGAATGAGDELEVVAVQVEGVRVAVVVVEGQFDDRVIREHEGVCVGAVNGWVVEVCGRCVHGCVKSRNFGRDVVDIVQGASSLAVGVGSEVDGQEHGDGHWAELWGCIQGVVDRIIEWHGSDGDWCWHWKGRVVYKECRDLESISTLQESELGILTSVLKVAGMTSGANMPVLIDALIAKFWVLVAFAVMMTLYRCATVMNS
jgi:hypothetical protein